MEQIKNFPTFLLRYKPSFDFQIHRISICKVNASCRKNLENLLTSVQYPRHTCDVTGVISAESEALKWQRKLFLCENSSILAALRHHFYSFLVNIDSFNLDCIKILPLWGSTIIDDRQVSRLILYSWLQDAPPVSRHLVFTLSIRFSPQYWVAWWKMPTELMHSAPHRLLT